MLSTYNRKKLALAEGAEEVKVFGGSRFKRGLEWNQYIGRVIINDFIMQLDEHQALEFAQYMPVLLYIEYGLLQSAIQVIEKIDIESLAEQKAWLLNALAEAEDRYE